MRFLFGFAIVAAPLLWLIDLSVKTDLYAYFQAHQDGYTNQIELVVASIVTAVTAVLHLPHWQKLPVPKKGYPFHPNLCLLHRRLVEYQPRLVAAWPLDAHARHHLIPHHPRPRQAIFNTVCRILSCI